MDPATIAASVVALLAPTAEVIQEADKATKATGAKLDEIS
jgi:hypothetical protein